MFLWKDHQESDFDQYLDEGYLLKSKLLDNKSCNDFIKFIETLVTFRQIEKKKMEGKSKKFKEISWNNEPTTSQNEPTPTHNTPKPPQTQNQTNQRSSGRGFL